MVHHGHVVGTINLTIQTSELLGRGTLPHPGPSPIRRVIAIENVRLFTQLQARNRELTDALEQQTATSEHPARHQPLAD